MTDEDDAAMKALAEDTNRFVRQVLLPWMQRTERSLNEIKGALAAAPGALPPSLGRPRNPHLVRDGEVLLDDEPEVWKTTA